MRATLLQDELLVSRVADGERIKTVGEVQPVSEWEARLGEDSTKRLVKLKALAKPTEQERNDFIKAQQPFKSDIDPKAYALHDVLRQPDLFERLLRATAHNVVAEDDARATLLLIASGIFCQNAHAESSNLMVNAESGTGKDWVIKHTLFPLFSKETLVYRTKLSKEAFTYWRREVKDWTWDGRIFYLEDIESSILNSPVFKVMASGGTSATVVIKNKSVDIEVKGKPCMIVTAAESELNSEALRRWPILFLTETEEQTASIKKRQALQAKGEGKSDKTEEATLRNALTQLGRVTVDIPFADDLHEKFPNSLIVRTAFPRFLDWIKFSAALHQMQRQRNAKGAVIAESQDYMVARRVLSATTQTATLTPLTRKQKELLAVFEAGSEEWFCGADLLSNSAVSYKKKGLYNALDMFVQRKLLKREAKPKEGYNRDVDFFRLASVVKFEVLPSWEELNQGKLGTIEKHGTQGKLTTLEYKKEDSKFPKCPNSPKFPMFQQVSSSNSAQIPDTQSVSLNALADACSAAPDGLDIAEYVDSFPENQRAEVEKFIASAKEVGVAMESPAGRLRWLQ